MYFSKSGKGISPEQVFTIREKVLDMRVETEMNCIQRQLDKKRISPKTFEDKRVQLEKWVDSEKKNINQTKDDLQKVRKECLSSSFLI